MINKLQVETAIAKWPGLYQDQTGNLFYGMPVSQVPSQLRECGWKNVSRLDESDFRKMGLEILTARYVGGVKPYVDRVRPKQFCRVVKIEKSIMLSTNPEVKYLSSGRFN